MRSKSICDVWGLVALSLLCGCASIASSPLPVELVATPSARSTKTKRVPRLVPGEDGEGESKATPEEARKAAADQEKQEEDAEEVHFLPVNSRWFSRGNPVFVEGVGGVQPAEYEEVNNPARWWNSYRQNKWKGDFPILGTEDIFLNVTATNRSQIQRRKLPVSSFISGPSSVTQNFFGDGHITATRSDFALTFDLFKGQQAFKPVEWRLKFTPILNFNGLYANEDGVTGINIDKGTTRHEEDVTFQEAFVEVHLLDLSDRYDFLSSEIGVFPFRSDFRGFVFDDVNRGIRLFGNYDNNKTQFNLVYFDMMDKDTNSELNNYDDREQEVFVANIYRQDWPVLGFTSSASFHYNNDHRGTEFDDNGFLVSPAPVGLAQQNKVESYYFGVAGEGHWDRLNITTALYQAYGEDDNNPFAARDVDINAQLAALELSVDFDWWRVRLFGMYASGDDDARDGDAEGFDAILDAPNFAGGEFSFFNSQAIQLLGVKLTNGLSPLPDLQSSKVEGKSNFVNPGLGLLGLAFDAEITPTLRAMVGASYLRFDETAVLETYLQLPKVENEIGIEIFFGSQWRPALTQNVVVQVGASALMVGDGFERIYQSDDTLYALTLTTLLTW